MKVNQNNKLINQSKSNQCLNTLNCKYSMLMHGQAKTTLYMWVLRKEMLFYRYINVFLRWEDSGHLKKMQRKQKHE